MRRNKNISKAWHRWRNTRKNAAWRKQQTGAAFIIVGSFLLLGLIAYRLGYRHGVSRSTGVATTSVSPSSTSTTEASSPSTGLLEEPQPVRELRTSMIPEPGNGHRTTGSPVLSEEFGTQQLFSHVVPYIKKTVYIE